MLKDKRFVISYLLLTAMFLLAACGPAVTNAGGAVMTPGSDSDPGTMSVPQTGLETQAAALAGACVDVDTQRLMASGQAFYETNCAECHGAEGEGQGDVGPLAGNAEFTTAAASAIVQRYLAVDAHPKSVDQLDLAGALSYARGSFGNTGRVVCPADIQLPTGQ